LRRRVREEERSRLISLWRTVRRRKKERGRPSVGTYIELNEDTQPDET